MIYADITPGTVVVTTQSYIILRSINSFFRYFNNQMIGLVIYVDDFKFTLLDNYGIVADYDRLSAQYLVRVNSPIN